VTLLMALFLAAAGPEADAARWRAELPAGLSLEDPQDPDMRREREARTARTDQGPKYGLGLQVQGRWSFPLGSANRDTASFRNPGGGVAGVYDSSLAWSDLFRSGWGTSFTAEVTVVRAGTGDGGYGRAKNNFSVGGYLSFLQNHLIGDTVSDGAGNRISVEDMALESYLVGVTMYQNLGHSVYTEGRLGVGAVHYSEVNGTFNVPFPFAQNFKGTMFRDTWNLAAELRGGLGYRIGPLGFTLGMGLQFMMPPDAGGAIDLNPGALMTWDIDLGAELGF